MDKPTARAEDTRDNDLESSETWCEKSLLGKLLLMTQYFFL